MARAKKSDRSTSAAKRLEPDVILHSRRDRILAVARSHFARFGFRRTVIDDIAAEAGCAKGAVYLEFASKEALLQAVIDEVRRDVGARFAAAMAEVQSPRERLERTLRFAYREMAREPMMEKLVLEDPEVGVLRAMVQEGMRSGEADAQIASIQMLVRQGIEAGELRPDLDIEVMPFVLSVLRYLHFHTELATGGRVARERLLDAVVDIFIAGISAPPAGAPGPEPTRKGTKRNARNRDR